MLHSDKTTNTQKNVGQTRVVQVWHAALFVQVPADINTPQRISRAFWSRTSMDPYRHTPWIDGFKNRIAELDYICNNYFAKWARAFWGQTLCGAWDPCAWAMPHRETYTESASWSKWQLICHTYKQWNCLQACGWSSYPPTVSPKDRKDTASYGVRTPKRFVYPGSHWTHIPCDRTM